MLGSVEPLEYTEVLSWLRAESEKETGDYVWVSFELALAIPQPKATYGADYVEDETLSQIENDREWYKHWVNNLIDNCYDPTEIHYSLDPFLPGSVESRGYVWQENGKNHVINMKNQKLIELTYWAEKVIKVCPELQFQQAVQLILHGNMYSLEPKVEVKHRHLETKLTEFKILGGCPSLPTLFPMQSWHPRGSRSGTRGCRSNCV